MWIVKIIIFTIPFLPLYIISSMPFPFITGRNFAFRILVELAAALWIGLLAAKKEYRIRNSPVVLSVLTFTFIVGLADLSGVDPYSSFWSNFERMEGYITILHLALYFMIIKSIFKTRNDWKIFFAIILLASVSVSLFPFVFSFSKEALSFKQQMLEYGTREFSLIGNPPFLASYLLMATFIGLILIFHMQKTYLRLGCLMAVVLNCVVIYLTGTRGAILSAIAGVIIFVSLSAFGGLNKSGFRILKRTVLLMLVISIIISGVFVIVADTETVMQDQTLSRFVSILSSDSVKSRLNVWGMAWNAIKERPILGWGQENFISIYSVNPLPLVFVSQFRWMDSAHAPFYIYRGQIWLDRAHNIVIEWLVNAGFLGLFSYLAIFGSAFFVLKKADQEKVLSRKETVIILLALVVYFIQNLFTFDTINTYMLFFALLAYIDNLSINEKEISTGSKTNIDSKKTRTIFVSVTLALLLFFSPVFYYINYKPIRQARQVVEMIYSTPKKDSYSLLLGEFNNALSYNTLGDSSVRRSMMALSSKIIRMYHFNQKGAPEFIRATVKELRKDIANKSYDLEYMTDIIRLFYEVAVYNKSFIKLTEGLIERCMHTNSEYQLLNMLMANVNILQKDYERAFTYVKSIAVLDPENEKKQFMLALAAVYSSREEVVKQALGNIKKIRMSNDKNMIIERKSFIALSELYQLAQVYRKMKYYTEAVQYLEEIITIAAEEKMYFDQDVVFYRPTTKKHMIARVHIEIARMYFKLNDRLNAMEEVEKAVKIDPGLSENKQAIIDSINNEI